MWDEDVESAARRRVAWLIGIVVAAVIALGGWYWYASRQRPAAATPVVAAPAPPPVSSEPQIEHPIAADNAPGSAALPALNDSDQIVHDSLAGVLGRHAVWMLSLAHLVFCGTASSRASISAWTDSEMALRSPITQPWL